jgi:hypothetical protein
VVLSGWSGANPLGFMASLGLLRLLSQRSSTARIGFLSDGSFHPFVELPAIEDLPALVAEDAALAGRRNDWLLEYEKLEKKGARVVADLKAPPHAFETFVDRCIELWSNGDGEAAAFAASFGTTVALDGKGNTKPTAFHFTAANQEFLGSVEAIRESVTADWAKRSLFEGHAVKPGSNLRWDPSAERNWALMADNPNEEGTSVDAPSEWLGFRGLPLFPCFPVGSRITTTCVDGRGDAMRLTWPLWSLPASLETVRSVLQLDWAGPAAERSARGIFGVCTSAIRRTAQGFGNFGPASVAS